MEYITIITNFISAHYQWFFSGLGVFILGFFFIKNHYGQSIKQGNNSKAFQAGRDININK